MRIPKLRLHATGQYCVTLNKKTKYLGTDKIRAQREYKKFILENFGTVERPQFLTTVGELLDLYVAHVMESTHERWRKAKNDFYKQAFAIARRHYGGTPTIDFRPLMFQNMRKTMAQQLITFKRNKARKRSRYYVNKLCKSVKAAFRWGVGQEMVLESTYSSLAAIDELKHGEMGLPEGKVVRNVEVAVVEKTMEFMSERNADILRMMLLTGCRPDELLMLTPGRIDKSDSEFWQFVPPSHKTARFNKKRVVLFAKESQRILEKYSKGPEVRYFDWLGDSHALCQAVYRACDRGKVVRWCPYRLRHTAVTKIALEHGKDVAQAVAGHSSVLTTERYDHGNLERAKRAAG